jgi:hypothetical protein
MVIQAVKFKSGLTDAEVSKNIIFEMLKPANTPGCIFGIPISHSVNFVNPNWHEQFLLHTKSLVNLGSKPTK